MQNPYLDEFQQVCPKSWLDPITLLRYYDARERMVFQYSFAVPTSEVVNKLVRLSPIVEIGAGTGYWAWLLQQLGATVVAFDLEPKERSWTGVQLGDGSDAVREFQDHTLFLCWPPYDTPMAYDVLFRYTGSHLIYIGEGEGGCTGDDKFHQLLDTDWNIAETLSIPQWDGIHDRVYIYER